MGGFARKANQYFDYAKKLSLTDTILVQDVQLQLMFLLTDAR